MSLPTRDQLMAALATVEDPEIHQPITELGMVDSVDVDESGHVTVTVLLTVAGCPLKTTIEENTREALLQVEGVCEVTVTLGVMNDEQRAALQTKLRGGAPARENPFAKPDNLTRIYAIASGKGGVGKSSVTTNLAVAMAKQGLKVGLIDADIYGFSIPRMIGVDTPATQVEDMIMPPTANGVKVMSIGMFVPDGQPVVWRGPMLHRALEQFLSDVFWGDLDVLMMDLPPGTGDVAISLGQLLPSAEIVVVTTPQVAAAEVAERAGSIAAQTNQRVVGVVENMAWLEMPDGSRNEIFGSGGGQKVAESLTEVMGTEVPLLGQVPLDTALREGGDIGQPVTLNAPDSPAGAELSRIAEHLGTRARGLAGRKLGVTINPN